MRGKADLPHVRTLDRVIEELRLLSTPEVARLLGLSPNTVKYWRRRSQRTGPKFVRLGKHVRYSWKDLSDYLKSRAARSRGQDAKSIG